ncbi:MAG: sigma-70 family RNA polymerase sigma factor [Spirochaetes bacterium]|nr:sigma-70 family RNA polymerase sigma factor [Spirochaetota bacterium]
MPFQKEHPRNSKNTDKALQAVYAKVYPQLQRYVARFVDSDRAEDVVQDTFEKMFIKFAAASIAENDLVAWLYRVAHNRAIDIWRKERKTTSLDEVPVKTLARLSEQERSWLQKERDDAVLRAAAGFDKSGRGLLLYQLLCATELPPEKIAASLSMTPRTCRRFMDALFAHIQKELEKLGYGAEDF